MKPPLAARALLLVLAGDREAELVAGDLEEEFLLYCAERGTSAARRWYLSQVIRSALPLWTLRMQNGEIAHAAAAAGLGVALPLLLLDRLWSLVYSLVPLKDGLDRAPVFLAVNLLFVCALASLCGATAGSLRRALVIALAVCAAAGFALWGSAGAAPPWYAVAVVLCPPASALAAFRSKRRLV